MIPQKYRVVFNEEAMNDNVELGYLVTHFRATGAGWYALMELSGKSELGPDKKEGEKAKRTLSVPKFSPVRRP